MSLTRGTSSKRPCPVCTVKEDELAEITKTWPPRIGAHAQDLVERARTLKAIEREKLLSEEGIRNVEVIQAFSARVCAALTPTAERILACSKHRPTSCALVRPASLEQ